MEWIKRLFNRKKKVKDGYIYRNGKAYKFTANSEVEWLMNYWSYMCGTAIDSLKEK